MYKKPSVQIDGFFISIDWYSVQSQKRFVKINATDF